MPRLLPLALVLLAVVVLAPPPALAVPPPPPGWARCRVEPAKRYSLAEALRQGIVVPTRCDKATEAFVSLRIMSPNWIANRAAADMADGSAVFGRAGRKPIRVRMRQPMKDLIHPNDTLKVRVQISVELPDRPDWIMGQSKNGAWTTISD